MRVFTVQRVVLTAALAAAGLWSPRSAVADNQPPGASSSDYGSPSGNTANTDANTQSPRATTQPATDKDMPASANTAPGQTGTGMAADQASTMKPADERLSQRVELAIEQDQSLSTVANNVHVVARDGKVLLMGTVPSKTEKTKVEQHARRIAGKNNVNNQIEISTLQ